MEQIPASDGLGLPLGQDVKPRPLPRLQARAGGQVRARLPPSLEAATLLRRDGATPRCSFIYGRP